MKALERGNCRGAVEALNEAVKPCSPDEISESVDDGQGGAVQRKRKTAVKRRKSRAGQRQTPEQRQLELLLEIVGNSEEARATLQALRAARRGQNEWRGLMATPPGLRIPIIPARYSDLIPATHSDPFPAT